MKEPITPFLKKRLRHLVKPTRRILKPADQERHRIYAGALATIIRYYWCGNKYGISGKYPLNPKLKKWKDKCPHLRDEYRGHNIAALAVDHDGHIIDFDFNHNKLFDSSAEHAEARLVRRLFSLTQLQESWNVSSADNPADKYSNALSRVTIYTSLESCTQCTGIMMLGRVRRVIFLQQDPGMYRIGNLLHTLTTDKEKEDFIRAPEPVAASRLGMTIDSELDVSYRDFVKKMRKGKIFHKPQPGKGKQTQSITSFLCTASALSSFSRAAEAFNDTTLEHASHKPSCIDDIDNCVEAELDNRKALEEAKDFANYATAKGHRGTPHR